MFTIAGILADEEPKTAVSASGLYDSSVIDSNKNFSETLFAGLEEFTVMYWVYHTGSGYSIFQEYNNTDSSKNIKIRTALNSVDQIELTSTAGTTLTVLSNSLSPTNTWTHVCFTGSLANNRLRVYKNGVLDNSAVMPYGVTSDTNRARLFGGGTDSLAQWSFYNRELSEEEVSEHYVYDSDTMTSGVLGYDAMTTSQRSGLIYLSSFIDDIPFDGSEFKDRSGNNITLSSQPSLTGQQIYVYTDASDLPSDEPNAFAPNVATLDGSTQRFELGQPSQLDITGDITVSAWINLDDATSIGNIISRFAGTDQTQALSFYVVSNSLVIGIGDAVSGATFLTDTTFTINTDTWYFVTATLSGTTLQLYVNAQSGDSTTHAGGIGTPNVDWVVGGTEKSGELYTLDGNIALPMVFNRALNSSEITALYNDGAIPCYADIDTSITDDCVYAPNLMTFNGRTEASALVDNSSSGITTTAVGSPTYEPTGALIVSDGDVQYNGSYSVFDGSDYLDGGSTDLAIGTQSYSWNAWVKYTSTGYQVITSKWGQADTTNSVVSIAVSSTNGLLVDHRPDQNINYLLQQTDNAYNDGEWHHFIGYVDTTAQEIYMMVDGVTVTTNTSATLGNPWQTISQNDEQYRIGARDNLSSLVYFTGELASVGIAVGADLRTVSSELYNDGVPPSFASLSSSTQALFTRHSDLVQFNGSSEADALTENGTLSGASDLTNNGATFESELAVECDEDLV